MRVVVAGASGLIGTPLVTGLREDGHEVLRLVRREPSAPDEARWDPQGGSVAAGALDGVDAVVNLAGAGIGDKRWTEDYKREVRDSRVLGTRTLVSAMMEREDRPLVFVNGSAVGWYGDTGDTPVTEDAPPGDGFLAEVCEAWEAEALPAAHAGIRTVLARTGLVTSSRGGLGARLLPIFKLGAGGPLASGEQYMPIISLDDEVAALRWALESEEASGPVNLCLPEAVTNKEFTRAMGRAVHRPAIVPVPRFALRIVLGEFADEGALASQRVQAEVLRSSGFTFLHGDVQQVCEAAAAGR